MSKRNLPHKQFTGYDGPVMKVADLKPHSRNPRKMSNDALEKLMESIDRNPEFMKLRPIVIDDDNIVLGGNQRLRAIKELNFKVIPAAWVVKASELSVEQKREFMIIDNSPEGMSGVWDLDILGEDWDKFQLEELGIDIAQIKFPGEEEGEEEDKEPVKGDFSDIEAKSMPEPKVGDMWLLGEHRLLCGDSTRKDDMDRVMRGENIDLYFGEVNVMARQDLLMVEEDGDPGPQDKPNVVMYSGGKDSTAVLLLMKEKGIRIDDVVYSDLGDWADPCGTHHEDVEKYFGIKITRVKMQEEMDAMFEKEGFPSVFVRWCTGIKVKGLDRYITEKYGSRRNIVQWIGIAYSERDRMFKGSRYSKHHFGFPLIEHRVDEEMALKMCLDAGFTFGGHYEMQARMGCWCCPLQRDSNIFDMLQQRPELFEKLKDMQKRSKRIFKFPNKTPWWYEHSYWARYLSQGDLRDVHVGFCKTASDEAVLPKTISYIRENSLKGQVVFCSDGYVDDVLVACQQIGRKCRAIEAAPQNVKTILERFRRDTGIEPVRESETQE